MQSMCADHVSLGDAEVAGSKVPMPLLACRRSLD